MRGTRAAFTLVELAVLVLIVGIVAATLVTMIPGQTQREARTVTKSHLAEIVAALERFKAQNGYYPCVASRASLPNTATYGRQVLVNCVTDTSTPAGTARVDAGGGAYVRFGVVPTRDLSLSDRHMADEFGNRYTYVVTEGLTSAATFAPTAGKLTILDAAGGTVTAEGGYVVVSHGKDGKGAYREHTGALKVACGATANLDVENCDGDASFRTASYSESTTEAIYFDDFITNVNKASLSSCINNEPPTAWPGIIKFTTAAVGVNHPNPVTTGDTNDDGLTDFLLADRHNNYAAIYNHYGKTSGWTSPVDLTALTAASNGFELTFDAYAWTDRAHTSKQPGDVNGDGIDDIIAQYDNDLQFFVVFGKTSGWSDTQAMSSLATSPTGFQLTGMASGGVMSLSLGNVNGDAYDDIVFSDDSGNPDNLYVIFGKQTWGNTFDVTTLDGTNGFKVILPSDYITRHTSAAISDVDNDGFEDIIMGYHYGLGSPWPETVVIIFGKANGFSASYDLGNPASPTLAANMVAFPNAGYVNAFESGKDVNNDGFNDILIVREDGAALIFGRSDWNYGNMVDLEDDLLDNGGGVILSGLNTVSAATGGGVLGDINKDGCADIILGDGRTGPYDAWGFHDGTVYVVYGSNTLSPTVDVPTAANGTAGFKLIGNANQFNMIGVDHMAVGDFNDDGYDDFVINTSSSFVYIAFGRKTWPASMEVE